jgi:hypothetical protein
MNVCSCYDPGKTPLYGYLYAWRQWGSDPDTGEWSGRVFGPDHRTLAEQFMNDPGFPQLWLCSVVQNPVVDVIGDVIDLLVPELVPGELAILRTALDLICAKNENDEFKLFLAALGVVGGVIGVAEVARRRQALHQPAPTPV